MDGVHTASCGRRRTQCASQAYSRLRNAWNRTPDTTLPLAQTLNPRNSARSDVSEKESRIDFATWTVAYLQAPRLRQRCWKDVAQRMILYESGAFDEIDVDVRAPRKAGRKRRDFGYLASKPIDTMHVASVKPAREKITIEPESPRALLPCRGTNCAICEYQVNSKELPAHV